MHPPAQSTTSTEPIRTCVGCRAAGPVSTLVRFVASDGALVEGANQPGRGAWLCASTLVDCFDLATRQRSWARALRCQVEAASITALRESLDSGAAPR